MSLNQKNTKKQGDVGLGAAIRYYTAAGYTVSLPITDNQEYDLIVEKEDGLKRIQIKTTRFKRNDIYNVSLTIKGGNKSNSTIKAFDPQKVDFIFILTDDGDEYEIPSSEVKQSISLGNSKLHFKVTNPSILKLQEELRKNTEAFKKAQEQARLAVRVF